MAALVVLALALVQAVYCAPSGCGGYYPGPGPVYPGAGVIEVPAYPGYYGGEGVIEVGGSAYPGYYGGEGVIEVGGSAYPGYYGGAGVIEVGGSGYPGYPGVGLEEGCCPGPVVEKKTVVNKAVEVPFSYSEPVFSKKCFQRGSVNREVVPSSYETTPVCETREQITKLPSTDITTIEQPLCKTTCTTSEYVIQIPITETTCTSAPLCKKTTRSQDNLLTKVSKRTSCAKKVCTQEKVIEQPITETVCQKYEGTITKAGSKTVVNPEVVKSCVQLPPYKCLKPASPGPILYGGAGGYSDDAAYYGDGGYGAGYVSGPSYGGGYGYDSVEVPSYGSAVGPGCFCIA